MGNTRLQVLTPMPPGEDDDRVTKYVLNEMSELDRTKLETEMLIQKDISLNASAIKSTAELIERTLSIQPSRPRLTAARREAIRMAQQSNISILPGRRLLGARIHSSSSPRLNGCLTRACRNEDIPGLRVERSQ